MDYKPKGIIPALVTPLDAKENINEQGLRKLINHVIEGGVHGLFVIGTTGEFYGLTPEEKKLVIEITVDEVNKRIPVYAGTGAVTTRESVLLTEIAEECKVDAVSVLTPMFVTLSQNELYMHYKSIAESTGLPIILYNNAPKTGINISAETVGRLAEIDNIIGVKDSSGDFTLTAEYIRHTRDADFYVLAGRDTHIHACLCYGGTGAISACANVAPRICADIYDLYVEGDLKGSLEAQYAISPLRIAFTLGSYPTVIKEALSLIGIDTGPCLRPIGEMSPSEKAELKKILNGMELLE